MSSIELFMCSECWEIMRISTGPGRFRKYGRETIPLPADLSFPVCDGCGAEWMTDEDLLRLTEAIQQYHRT